MKNLKYLLLAASFLLGACTTAPKETIEELDPVIKAERESLLEATEYGIYRNGKPRFFFDKTQHQLYVNPTNRVFRIVDNAGIKYVELTLKATPDTTTPVDAAQNNTLGLDLSFDYKIILLKSDNEKLWLWSDAKHTGFILPKGGI